MTWDRFAIAAEIRRRGKTVTGLAIQAGLEPSACRVALVRPNTRGEIAISRFLGVPVEVLWPDRYSTSRTISNAWRGRRASQKRQKRAGSVAAA